MAEGAFDVSVRAVECANCGAPLEAPAAGGSVACTYCSASNVVRVRPAEAPHRAPSAVDDVARLARLETQKKNPLADNPFDMSRPPEGMAADAPLEALRAAFALEKTRPELSELKSRQRLLCWLATTIADRHAEAGEPLRARAVLETALDLLPDAGHRHILRCQLAVLAARGGEIQAAEAWLAECDPAPEVLALDTEYRLARVELDLHQNKALLARERLGETAGKVPTANVRGPRERILRIVVLAKLGETESALKTLCELSYVNSRVLDALRATRLAPELVAEQEKHDAAVERRLVVMEPLSWGCSALSAVFGGAIMWLCAEGSLSAVAGIWLFVALGAMLAVGAGLGVGATQRHGGIVWWPAALGLMACIPIGGLIIVSIVGIPTVVGKIPGARYRLRAELPLVAGLIVIAVTMIAIMLAVA